MPFAFFGAAAVFETPIPIEQAERALVLYAAIILSFMGGVQWGFAMAAAGEKSPPDTAHLTISVVPALVGWAAAMLETGYALPVLAASFVALLAFDLWTVQKQRAVGWYAPLRTQLTIAVVGVLTTVAVFR